MRPPYGGSVSAFAASTTNRLTPDVRIPLTKHKPAALPPGGSSMHRGSQVKPQLAMVRLDPVQSRAKTDKPPA